MPRHSEISLTEAINDFFLQQDHFPFPCDLHFDDKCFECGGTGYEEYFDADWFCPITMEMHWGTLEYKYDPCWACKGTRSILASLHYENERKAPEPYLGSRLRQVLEEAYAIPFARRFDTPRTMWRTASASCSA